MEGVINSSYNSDIGYRMGYETRLYKGWARKGSGVGGSLSENYKMWI